MNGCDKVANRILNLPAIVLLVIGVGVAGPARAAEKTIILDGDSADWDEGDVLYADPEISEGVPLESTYSRVYVANDATFLYIGLETKGTGGGSINNPWGHNVYLDTDNDPATGYNGGTLAGGYDWLIQYGVGGFEETAFSFNGATQADENWQFVNYVVRGSSENFVELGFELANLGLIVGDTPRIAVNVSGDGITTETWAPAAEADAKTYEVVGPPPPPPLDVVLDGSLSEWGTNYLFYTDNEIVDGEPLNSTYSAIHVASNDDYLFVGFEVKGSNGATIDNDWVRQIFIDSDANPNTGFNGGWMANGYDHLVEYGWGGTSYSLFEFTGANQATWGWNYVGLIEYSFTDSILEWGIPRDLLGPEHGDISVLEFSVSGGSVTIATWAHSAEGSAKTHRFASGVIPTGASIDGISIEANTVHLTLSGLTAGASTAIETTADPAAPAWTPVGSFTSQGPTTNWTGTADAPAAVYRINTTTP
jgi:hypothetical protein